MASSSSPAPDVAQDGSASRPRRSRRSSQSSSRSPDPAFPKSSVVAGPSRLTKAEVASYFGIVEDLEGFSRSDLATRLASPSMRYWDPTSSKRLPGEQSGRSVSRRRYQRVHGGDEEEEDEEEEVDLSDDDTTTARSKSRLKSKSISHSETHSISGPRRMDGPSFTPVYQDKDGNLTGRSGSRGKSTNTNGTKRKRREVRWDERESTRWPLSLSELPDHLRLGQTLGQGQGRAHDRRHDSESVDGNANDAEQLLEESVVSFASAFIRLNGLKFPSIKEQLRGHPELDPDSDPDTDAKSQSHRNMTGNVNTGLDLGMEEDLEPQLPDDLVSSTLEMIDQVLVNLAACRPAEMGNKRKKMGTMDWSGVVGAGGMASNLRDTAQSANARLREIYKAGEPDILSHRLDILRPRHPEFSREADLRMPATSTLTLSTPTASTSMLDDLYAPVVPKKDTAFRRHQSKAEQERREEARRLRAEKKTNGKGKKALAYSNGSS